MKLRRGRDVLLWTGSCSLHCVTLGNVSTDSSPGGGRRNSEVREGRMEEREAREGRGWGGRKDESRMSL